MKRFNLRLLLIALFCLAALAQLLFTDAPEILPQAQADDEAPTMTIGSPAPRSISKTGFKMATDSSNQ